MIAKTEPIISLSEVTKYYDAFQALRGVNLKIYPGITGLLGPNGAGKSTLIKILLGLVSMTSGSGTILGLALGRDGRKIRSRIGFVPEDDCYIPGLTGVEVVQFAATLSGIESTEALRRSHEILDFCGMKQERYRNIETYSTGMRQKIKFAAAIVHDPEFLVLDEPTSGLDPEEREALLNRVRLLANSGKSVLLSTHILPDVQGVCDHVVILSGGIVRLDQSLDQLNRPVNQSVTLELIGNSELMISELKAAGVTVVQQLSGGLRIDSADDQTRDLVWRIARDNELELTSLRPAKNSLEEIFISAVSENKHADL